MSDTEQPTTGTDDTAAAEQAIDQATEAVTIEANRLDELGDTSVSGDPIGMANLMDVPVRVTVEVGRTKIPLSELVDLGPGSLVVLDREAHEPADILVNGKIVATGEVVTIDGSYGIRITRVMSE